jgi:phosphatidylglycerol lysyltransferase
MTGFKRLLPYLGPLFILAVVAVAVTILHEQLSGSNKQDILASLRSIPFAQLAPAIALTALNYLVLMGYDLLALKCVGRELPLRQVGLVSFIGTAFSNNIGLSTLAGGSIRFRLYATYGLSVLDIGKVLLFSTATLWLGLFAVSGAGLVLAPEAMSPATSLPGWLLRILGGLMFVTPLAYVLACARLRRSVTIRGAVFTLPSWRFGLAQTLLSGLDWLLAASALYVLLPQGDGLGFGVFLSIYLVAQLLGLVSQTPGALGVLEATLMALMSPYYETGALFAALLAYRGIYYFFPLAAATLALGARELVEIRRRTGQALGFAFRWISALAPRYLAIVCFVAGAVMIFSGATPAEAWRISWLKEFLPLPVLELSHFLSSLIGLGLVLISFGLQRRLDAAYWLTLGLLSLGMLVSLLKGLDWEEAAVLGLLLLALAPSRAYFYRKTSLFEERFEPAWIVAIAVVLLSALWLAFFSFKHVSYNSTLWWTFTMSGQASRTLRAEVAVTVLALVFASVRLLRPSRYSPPQIKAEDLERARTLALAHPHTYAHLALLGDKHFLFSEDRSAFLMYGVSGRSWVCMGDPIGEERAVRDLAWRFRELCDRHAGWPIFYEADRDYLHIYLDLGLALLKIGEEARVDLSSFNLEGKSRKNFRNLLNKMDKSGATFELVPAPEVPALLPELKLVSDAWLTSKRTREKRFSLGSFQPEYLSCCPMALLRKEGRITAFANVWLGGGREELSVDLMRYLPEAPDDVMDCLFLKLMLWGKAEGYAWFNLGMAPWSGFESRALASIWSRFGAFLFQYGEHFYNFQGLRNYKEKFDPRWEPKYLACPSSWASGLTLPRILANIASLVSGGITGAFSK